MQIFTVYFEGRAQFVPADEGTIALDHFHTERVKVKCCVLHGLLFCRDQILPRLQSERLIRGQGEGLSGEIVGVGTGSRAVG